MDNLQQERHSWIKFLVIFSWLFAYGLITVLAGSGGPQINLDDVNMKGLLYFGQVVGVIFLFVGPAFLFAGVWTKARIPYLGITTKASFSTLFLACLGILAAFPLINWLASINEQMHLPASMHAVEEWMRNSEEQAAKLTEVFTRGTTVGGLILNLFVVAFMAAFSEELFFRGVLQKVLIECFKNKHVAVWVGAAFFSAFHMQFFGFIPRMMMGAFLGYLFLWSGSIWPGMMAHFVNNGTAVLFVWLANRDAISPDVDKIGAESNQLVYVIVSTVIMTACMIIIYRNERKRRTAGQLS